MTLMTLMTWYPFVFAAELKNVMFYAYFYCFLAFKVCASSSDKANNLLCDTVFVDC